MHKASKIEIIKQTQTITNPVIPILCLDKKQVITKNIINCNMLEQESLWSYHYHMIQHQVPISDDMLFITTPQGTTPFLLNSDSTHFNLAMSPKDECNRKDKE